MLDARPKCGRVVVPEDLRENWRQSLTREGFDPEARTAWLAEGLLVYLSLEESTRLLEGVTALSAKGIRLSLEDGGFAKGTFETVAQTMPRLLEYTSLWKGGLGRMAPEVLARLGWRVERQEAAQLAESFGRAVPQGAGGGYLVATRS